MLTCFISQLIRKRDDNVQHKHHAYGTHCFPVSRTYTNPFIAEFFSQTGL